MSELRDSYPFYSISKNKIELKPGMDVDALISKMQNKYASQPHSMLDGLKIEFGNEDEVEGKCIFEDYESENNIISLGILPDKENLKADVYADILSKEDIEVK